MYTVPVAFTIPAYATLSVLDGRWLVTSFGDPDDDLLAVEEEPEAVAAEGDDDAVDIRIVPALRR